MPWLDRMMKVVRCLRRRPPTRTEEEELAARRLALHRKCLAIQVMQTTFGNAMPPTL